LNKNLFFAVMFLLTVFTGTAQAGGELAGGAELAEECANCRGEDGKAMKISLPSPVPMKLSLLCSSRHSSRVRGQAKMM